MKTFPAAQLPLLERPHAEPLYFCHLYLSGETLYFSDRNFKFNGHDYEAYFLDIPGMVHSIERFGGYLNINGQFSFWNRSFRSYDRLIDFFITNPITRREMDLFVLYIENGQIPGTDVSTKLHKLSFGEFKRIQTETFDIELFSILHSLDSKKLFTQINRTNWPNTAPSAIGKYENQIYGLLRNIPCHPVDVGAVSTLFSDLTATANEIFLSDVDYPIAFPFSGTVQIGIEQITYTGKDSTNKKLTGCTRGSPARAYKTGEPIWEIKASYKYLAAGHKMKSILIVYVADVRAAECTTNLNDNGKSTIAFTSKNLLKSQGAHSHGSKIKEPWNPTNSSFTYDAGMGAWGAAGNLKDKNEGTGCGVGITGALGVAKDAYFTITFPPWNGITPDAVYVYLVCNWNLGFLAGEYFNLVAPESVAIGIQGQSNSTYTHKIKLTGTSVPTTVTVRAHTNAGNPVLLVAAVYEMWLELEFENIASGGENSVWSKLVPLVTCDGEGYQDDGSGTYTGTPNALIENHADVRMHMLVALLGRTMSEIGTSFNTMRADTDQKFGMILSTIGQSPADIFSALDSQSCYQMKEDGGKFELIRKWGYLPDVLPTDGTGITANGYYGGYLPRYSCDDSISTHWQYTAFPSWLKVDFGAGNEKKIKRLNILPLWYSYPPMTSAVKDFTLAGSNNDIDYTTLYSGTHGNTNEWEFYDFENETAYRYHKLTITTAWIQYVPGVAEWQLQEKYEPEAVLTIDKTIFVDDPVFSQTPAVEIKNLIRVTYDLDYGGTSEKRKFGNYFRQTEQPNAASISKYGELPKDIGLPTVQNPIMAKDIGLWQLSQTKDVIPLVHLPRCNKFVRRLERGDYFILNDVPIAAWNGLKWKVLEIGEVPESQTFSIRAIQWVSS